MHWDTVMLEELVMSQIAKLMESGPIQAWNARVMINHFRNKNSNVNCKIILRKFSFLLFSFVLKSRHGELSSSCLN